MKIWTSRLGSSVWQNDIGQKCPYHKIVIIGAGMAGLGAGRFLKDTNFEDFVILEAQDRVGGRVETLEWQEHVLELGAQWLHGTQNPLYEIAKKHGLLAEETSEEGLGLYIRENGETIDDFLVKLVDFKIGEIFTECERFFKTPCIMKSAGKNPDESPELTETPCTVEKTEIPKFVGEFLEREFRKYLDESPDSEALKQIKWELFDWHVRFQIVDNSCRNLSDLSAKCWGQYVCVDDETHVNLQNGYRPLVHILAEDLPIELAKPVLKIDYDNGSGNSAGNSVEGSNKVRIFLQDGSAVTCDHVIVTVPLGVLKENGIDFEPPLPGEITRSIQDMGYFGIGKIYLIFDRAWWGDTKGFQFIWSRAKNSKNLNNPEKSANVETTNNENSEEIIGENSWLRHITGFDPVFNQPKVLIGWVGGEGVEIMEKLSEAEVGHQCMKLLRHFVRFRADIPDPVKVIRTTWCSNPYAGGSYCHITPKCDHNFERNSEDSGTNSEINSNGAQSALSRPIFIGKDLRLLLAGEACHPSHYSTTHGAFESGQSQAEVLYGHILKEKNL